MSTIAVVRGATALVGMPGNVNERKNVLSVEGAITRKGSTRCEAPARS